MAYDRKDNVAERKPEAHPSYRAQQTPFLRLRLRITHLIRSETIVGELGRGVHPSYRLERTPWLSLGVWGTYCISRPDVYVVGFGPSRAHPGYRT